jgi:flagellar hook protein FlgE
MELGGNDSAVDTGGTAGSAPVEIGSGNLGFDEMGKMTSPTTNPTLSITGLASGAADMAIVFSLVDSVGNTFITDYAGESTVSRTTQNGLASSNLKDISINSEGVIVGLTESGQSIPLAQLALANFPNVEGLQKYEGSTFVAFTSSGEPSIGAAGAGRGSIVERHWNSQTSIWPRNS